MKQQNELDELSIGLFKTFARFEFALKASGYVRNGGNVSADWTRFALDNPNYFDGQQSSALQVALRYLDDHPPKKQVVVEGA